MNPDIEQVIQGKSDGVIVCGDCMDLMKGIPVGCVQCCVTSPPYWGLRSYGHWTMQTVWGTWDDFTPSRKHKDRWKFRLLWRAADRGGVFSRDKKTWIGAYGLEPTPELYIQHTVDIFREVRRVLRDDATLWLNLGDSYATNRNDHVGGGFGDNTLDTHSTIAKRGKHCPAGLKMKDLCGIPWRVALALQADGWYLRQDIIWHKPNPMPESCTDRCTKAHEYIFLLTKRPRYFYDQEAIKEPSVYPDDDRKGRSRKIHQRYPTGELNEIREGNQQYTTRNKRSVWTVTTKAFSEAHFATFPPKLIEPCILAGTSKKGRCPECGSPWDRVVERTSMVIKRSSRTHSKGQTRSSGTMVEPPTSTTTGWRPTCQCGRAETLPCIVLDPYMGSGTVGVVCAQNQRDYIGIELNPEYAEMARERTQAVELNVPVAEARNGQKGLFA